MKVLRVCLAQINTTVGDLKNNSRKIIEFTRKAERSGADIVAFPELSLSGYPPEDLLLKPHFIKENKKRLLEIVKTTGSILSIVGFPHEDKGRLFNAAALIYNRKILDIYKKIFLPNYGVFDEKRYFEPGRCCNVISFSRNVKIGINICEDIWHPEGPQRTQALLGGAKVIINISSSPYHAGKINQREKMLKERARENNAFILYCNLVGGQDELVFDGGSLAFDNKGRLLARGKQFEEDLVTADLNISDIKKAIPKKKIIFGLPKSSLRTSILPELKDKKPILSSNRIEKKYRFLDEIYVALTTGIRDYVRKNNFKKVVLGLSGGIDSALTLVLACDALGKDNVAVLTMPSRYTSAGTKKDAEKISDNLGVRLITVPIEHVYRNYLVILGKHFKGLGPDITEENLQARIRGSVLMAFSNKFGWLVLSTGNKSEISTGYCTLYGDMVGGFAILKDVPKDLVYKLAEHKNRCAGKEVIPKSIIRRPPTAELKKNQKDQDTLPPYPVLDRIIDLYVEKDAGLDEIVKKGFNKKLVDKVINMIDKNEYKRRQAPPGIKITPKAFGRDRRMPITNAFSQ